ncbi:MAG TPA: hypothetical protein VKA03_01780 [Methylovirgula sp.]|nr:hypothetical protein [Methylovirgula sp.]
MIEKTYILVFQEDVGMTTDEMKPFADTLKDGERLFRLDHNVAFLQTADDVETLTKRLHSGPLSKGYFFVADISDTSRAGNMVPRFWDILHNKDKLTPVA